MKQKKTTDVKPEKKVKKVTKGNAQKMITKEQIIVSYIKNRGNITYTCKDCKISRQTFYKYMEDQEFKKGIDDAIESTIDHVEKKLMDLVNLENPTAILFWLKCQGKKRGWTEKQEIDVNHNIKSIVIKPFTPDLLND